MSFHQALKEKSYAVSLLPDPWNKHSTVLKHSGVLIEITSLAISIRHWHFSSLTCVKMRLGFLSSTRLTTVRSVRPEVLSWPVDFFVRSQANIYPSWLSDCICKIFKHSSFKPLKTSWQEACGAPRGASRSAPHSRGAWPLVRWGTCQFHSLPLNELKVNETPILVQLNVSIPLSGYKDACLVPVSNGEHVF